MAYNLGCLVGAFMGGIVVDKFGRCVTIFSTGVLFCAGICWMCFNKSQAHTLMHIARIVQGFGVGNSPFPLPLFGAKVAPKEFRGMFSGFMQMPCVIGLFLTNVANIVVENRNRGWRTTNGVSMAPSLAVLLGIWCRQMLLIGAVGMIIGHLFTAILFTIIRDGNVDNAGCPKVANWAMGAVMTKVVKFFPSLNINGVLFLFAGLCFICLAFVYFFCPETKGIQLEGIEMLFHKGKNASSLNFVEVKSPISLA
ncbi:hypothetical protein BBJ29_007456 [Phytophthora kernoviae]|uniref:Major facilitator superfamily (MFS) profile domain-containing protein n=1 Tax=Phytophthora kernoviae TaxID=325452 RepID=A0A421FIZ7_9STRA|nr:hypothetical protein BBJ29_007456 [Phytophthora kernoviae]